MFVSRFSLVVSLLALFAVGLALAPRGSAQIIPQPQANPQGVSVVGNGIVLATPNTARITVGVDVFDPSLATAQAEAIRRMDAVIAQLRAAGIPDSDIRTVSFNINPQYDSRGPQDQPVLRGYQVQNLVEIKTTNVGGLGGLLDAAIGAGATRVYGIRFEADNMEALKAQARDQAMQNARAKAEQLARNAGVTLGRPITIEESDVGGVTPVRAAPAAADAFAAPASTPIQPGELQVQTLVRVTWAIQ